jgi:predicted Ser/Thr protein kinase
VIETFAPEFVALQKAVIGRYSLERELGRGGMGIVYLARDVALDRPVAIKLLPPAMAAQPHLRERFLKEAQMAARLSHPNIVPIYQVEQQGDLVWFVMAYVEGQTLGQRVREHGPLTPREATKIIRETAWALAYAHLRGIVHRDVKPDNVMLESASGRALVGDFGIARAGEISGGTQVGEILGTAQYMSPEQACGEKLDGRSDLYSLGVVAFFALSGRLPFDATEIPAMLAQHITKPAPPLASLAPGVPKYLADAVDRCLAKSPDDRFPTGEALAEALEQANLPARELPAPLRVWLNRGEGARSMLYGWSVLMGMAALGEIVEQIIRGGGYDADALWLLGVPWGVFALYRAFQTQRVIAAGYGLEDLRTALRYHIEKRREELEYDYSREPPLWARIVRRMAWGGLAVAAAGTAYVLATPIPSAELTAWLLGGGAAVACGGAIVGRMVPGKRLKVRDTMSEYRLKLTDTWLGRMLFRIAGIGVKRTVPASAAYRPTEVLIGMAAEGIYESLPKETRKQLRELPLVVKRLEADAASMRARVDELNGMMSGLGAESAAARSLVLRSGDESGGLVSGEHDRLRAALERERKKAAARLATSVAALENLRLDLMRLKAGVATLDELSADLAAARDIQAEIDLAIEAHREADAALGSPGH